MKYLSCIFVMSGFSQTSFNSQGTRLVDCFRGHDQDQGCQGTRIFRDPVSPTFL